jgi:hypothetical protein
MKAILFGLIVIGILILVSCRAMTVQPDASFMMDLASYDGYAPPAQAGFHPFVDGDNGPWL